MRDMFIDIRKSGKRPLWIGEVIWAELNAAWGSEEYRCLGSQAQAYEGMTSSTASSFASSSHETLHAQQISALQAELEQVRKSQADWQAQLQAQIQMQIQEQHNQLLYEMRKMREHMSGKEVAPAEEESADSE
ncbi:hypothetical protein MA16_Dca004502 [Dendrobium catenatum]|uniref:Uncharacterized protein n=1 Tax=Dendrobium catenatum TaxID=906689 RepID=A0A2I0W7P0_9ASPA|nr:hypothetical protein MA16_Dca004502 [Dendrobium catenatum]